MARAKTAVKLAKLRLNIYLSNRPNLLLKSNETMWKKYFIDFVQWKLNCELEDSHGSHHIVEYLLGCSTLETILCRTVKLHASLRLRPKGVGQTFTALRSLEELRPQHISLAFSDAQVTLGHPIQFTDRGSDEHYYDYVISMLYYSLTQMSTTAKHASKPFLQWCLSYQHVVSSDFSC